MNNVKLILLAVTIAACSCSKSLPDKPIPHVYPSRQSSQDSTSQGFGNDSLPPFPIQTINHSDSTGSQPNSCPILPLYGDSIVYPQPTAGDNIISPVNSRGAGKYFAWPAGMILDQSTGAINLTQSQAGMRYAIGFVPDGTKDTCISTFIIAGASYLDSAYNLSSRDTLARPYFNGNGGLTNVCSTPGACSFDYDGAAQKKGVIVDPSTGVIELSKTAGNGKGQYNGLFGGSPKNGATAIVSILYKLNDGSNNAPQQISVEFIYYDSKSQVPANLLSSMQTKAMNALNDRLISTSMNPRPPLIVITRKY